MVIYECPRCHYETSHKNTLRRHYNRKRVCKTLFSRKSIKDCKYELDNPKDKVMIDKDELEKLQEENRRLKECKTLNITNNIDNSITDNSKNITINSYNQTDIEGLRDDIEKLKIKNKKDEEVILNLLEMIHLNDKYPQNHNLYIENANLKRLMKLEGDKFEETGRGNKAIEDFLMKDVSKYIDNSFLSSSDFNVIYDSFMTKYYNCDADDSKNKQKDADEKSRILGIFFNAFYNGRHLIKDTARNNGIKVR